MTNHSGGRRTRRMGVRGSIFAGGAAGVVAGIAVGGLARSGLGNAGDARGEAGPLGEALPRGQEIQTPNGDVTGRQTPYGWDARRIGGAAAVQDGNANRAGYLDSAERLRGQL